MFMRKSLSIKLLSRYLAGFKKQACDTSFFNEAIGLLSRNQVVTISFRLACDLLFKIQKKMQLWSLSTWKVFLPEESRVKSRFC